MAEIFSCRANKANKQRQTAANWLLTLGKNSSASPKRYQIMYDYIDYDEQFYALDEMFTWSYLLTGSYEFLIDML